MRLKKTLFILFNLIFLTVNGIFSQSLAGASIVGKVMEASTEEPMEFVNVVLLKTADETQVKGAITGKGGEFRFIEIPPGEYFLQFSFIGFETKQTAPLSITDKSGEIDLGEINIQMDGDLLEEVEVVAEKSTYNFSIDRKIYNVEKDIMSQTSSATEILQNIPSITVDVDDQISLRGSSNITFFINGKPSALMRANSVAALRSIPANTIERIEIITNPSAKYRPDGVGGIINIVLKKETRRGLNGTLLGNIGNLDRQSANLTLNHSFGKVNVFGSYGFRHRNTPRRRQDTRINKDGNGGIISSSENDNVTARNDYSHVVNGGVDFSLGENTSVEIAGNYYWGKDDDKTLSTWTVEDESLSAFTIDQNSVDLEEEYELSALIEHEFDDDHTLSFELNYASYSELEDNFYDEKHTSPSVFNALSHNLVEKGGPLMEFSLEYARPIGEESELQAGYIGEILNDEIRFLIEDFENPEGVWVTDFSKTNHFILKQQIHAFYATFGHSVGAFSFLAGLRAEQALLTSDLITTDVQVPNNYFRLYPTLHLTYELGDKQELQLNYSRRVNRPDSDELNPFAEYRDPRNREVGNPDLKPENTHSLELGYHLQTDRFSFIPSLYYRYTYDAFTDIEEIVEDTVLQERRINLATEQAAGLEMILTGNVKEMLQFNFSINAFYNEIDASNVGLSNNRSNITWNSKLALNANFTSSSYAQINASYRSARINSQGKSRPLFLLNAGLRQDIWQNKASLTLTVSDVFNTLKFRRLIDTPYLYRNTTYKRNSQIVYLGFTYRFGKAFNTKKDRFSFEDNI